jgi:hypothetical protein
MSVCKAVFLRAFHWRRPGSKFGWGAQPGPQVQTFPRAFIAAAIKAGAAVPAKPRRVAEILTRKGNDHGAAGHRKV